MAASEARGGLWVRIAIVTFKLGIVGGALWMLLSTQRLDFSLLRVAEGATVWIWLALGLIFFQCAAMQYRFWVVLRASDVNVGVSRVMRVGFASWFLNASLLGGLGFLSIDAVRAAYLLRDTPYRYLVVGAVLIDRLIGLSGLLIISALAGLIGYAVTGELLLARIGLTASLCLIGMLGILALIGLGLTAWLPGRLRTLRLVGSVKKAIKHLLSTGAWLWSVTVGLLLSVIAQGLAIGAVYCLSKALFDVVPNLAALTVSATAAFLTAIAPLPANGLGVGEMAFDTVLRLVASAGDPLIAGATLFFAFRLASMLMAFVGLPAFLSLRLMKS